jgi:hypothetical protein
VRNWLAPALLIAALAAPALDPSLQFHFRDTGRFEYPVKQLLSDRAAVFAAVSLARFSHRLRLRAPAGHPRLSLATRKPLKAATD